MDEASEVVGVVLPSGSEAAEVAEPGKEPLDLPSSLVPAQFSAVLGFGLDAIGSVRSDQFDASAIKLLIERITVVGTIPDKASGSSHGEGCLDGSVDKGDFMWRSRRRVHSEWKTRSV